MTEPPPAVRRSDAERNRDRILDVARDAPATSGEVSPDAGFLWQSEQDAAWEQRSRRMLGVVLDGLHTLG